MAVDGVVVVLPNPIPYRMLRSLHVPAFLPERQSRPPLPSAWALGPPEGGVSVRPVPPTKRAGGELRNQYRSSIPELSNCNPELRSGIVTGHVVDPARESARLSRGWQSPQAPGSTGRSQADLVVDPARESLGLHGSRRSPQAPAQAAQALGGRRSGDPTAQP